MDLISLRDLPGIPDLVHEALDNRSRVDFGYPLAPDPTGWREAVAIEKAHPRPRQAIAEALHAQYDSYHPPKAVHRNIDALADPNTLAVISGQQVGLGGGPMLTLYKAMTAIAMAERMEKESGVRTVPIFWMATSDHNLPEAAQLHWFDTHNTLDGYRGGAPGNKTPVGMLPLGEHSEKFVENITAAMPETEFSERYVEAVRDCYAPDKTFAEAFRCLGLRLLGRYGLILLDAEDPALKRLSSPFFQAAVNEVDDRLDRLVARCTEIQQAGYKVQAPVEPGRPALFLLDDQQRRKVVLEGKSIRGHTDIILSRDELAGIAANEPERLSAGVTLRPLMQSWLLPTGAYIAGPHELAYWAELPTSFEPLGLRRPVVSPRGSLTVIEPKVRRWLDKYHLHPMELYGDVDQLATRLMPRVQDDDLDKSFRDLDDSLAEYETRFRALTSDSKYSGLRSSVDASFRKMHYHKDKLRHAFTERSKRQHGTLLKHLEQLSTHILPGGSPQERVISPLYYFVRFGDAFLEGLRRDILDTVGRHGFVDVKEWLP